ncbi:hypothetical protein L3556_08215 [Candidatus Synechococcus calcipolaris G9]|uniref:Uncharacterized protein n=1 Tax=Candidatus Synechococcus calcipolaris G9 TaxID=1497997 RepID=A0ABT6EZ86_9SYNE|nr:hypothetical protein [Candidatus Synechococcus calcipolaris]MDG2990910.1 hypothetical protein [Candidatus Synechococcus calcipolaris G9]
MKWAYDIVIVSGSALGFEVAFDLSLWGRVALVIPEKTSWEGSWLRLILPERLCDRFNEHPRVLRGDALRSWLQGQVERVQMVYSRAVLAAAGVDIIEGMGQFSQDKPLGLEIQGDRLEAPSYLLLDQPDNPLDLGEAYAKLLTPPGKNESCANGHRVWSVRGHGPELAEWIGLACLLEESVSWYIPGDRPLPQEDDWTNQRLQAYLEALGVRIYTQTPGSPHPSILALPPSHGGNDQDHQKEQEKTSLLDEWGGLGLSQLGLHCHPVPTDSFLNLNGFLKVNGDLQTRHPKIYACGSWLRGYDLPMTTKAEALHIGRNCLQKRRRFPRNHIPMIYKGCPWWLTTPYPLARVGWNLRQLTQSQNNNDFRGHALKTYRIQASPLGGDYGQIVTHNQQLLGATLVGYGAISASQTFALGLQKSVPWPDILAIAGWQLTD